MNESTRLINVGVTFLNIEATDALKQYAIEKVRNVVQKFVQQDSEAHVVLKVERNRQIAELSMHLSGGSIVVKEENDDLYVSIDRMVDSLTQQLRKHKEKATSHY